MPYYKNKNGKRRRTTFPESLHNDTVRTATAPPSAQVSPPGWHELIIFDGLTPSRSVLVWRRSWAPSPVTGTLFLVSPSLACDNTRSRKIQARFEYFLQYRVFFYCIKLLFIGCPHVTVVAVVRTISLMRRFTTYISAQFSRLTVSIDNMLLPGYGICYNKLRLFLGPWPLPWPQNFSEDLL